MAVSKLRAVTAVLTVSTAVVPSIGGFILHPSILFLHGLRRFFQRLTLLLW